MVIDVVLMVRGATVALPHRTSIGRMSPPENPPTTKLRPVMVRTGSGSFTTKLLGVTFSITGVVSMTVKAPYQMSSCNDPPLICEL